MITYDHIGSLPVSDRFLCHSNPSGALADAHRDGRLALFASADLGIGSDLQEMFPAWQEIPQNPACSSVLDHLCQDIIPLFVGDDMS
ncbi:MAG: hypothetical protein ABI134_23590, partial [Byssovorax sp.]